MVISMSISNYGMEKLADLARRKLSEGSQSDHIMLIKAFQVCKLNISWY
jgi:hypothetical protein